MRAEKAAASCMRNSRPQCVSASAYLPTTCGRPCRMGWKWQRSRIWSILRAGGIFCAAASSL
eukprot:4847666-Lingulodinium_polyedra.AAC.1